jgi:hypothetical protein
MKCINVTDKEYKGLDITIYETKHNNYVVDVKKPCGEFVWGYEFLPSFNCAMMKAVSFIDCMPQRGF